MKKLSNEELLAELEAPFPVDQVLWRVTNTANNRTVQKIVTAIHASPDCLYKGRAAGLLAKARVFTL